MSDNGAESGRLDAPPIQRIAGDWAASCCDNSYENMGRSDSYLLYGPNWARASGGLFNGNKGSTYEGGVRVPAFVHYPEIINQGNRNSGVATVMDLLPTFLELAGTEHPGTTYRDQDIYPLRGKSLLPVFNGDSESVHTEDYIAYEFMGRKSLRQGDWKIVLMPAPGIDSQWNLYNLSSDPSEQKNLALENPEKLAEILSLWKLYEEEIGLNQ
jgi:arylsulfatase A-like enzyme